MTFTAMKLTGYRNRGFVENLAKIEGRTYIEFSKSKIY
jgi:hypothetical protein